VGEVDLTAPLAVSGVGPVRVRDPSMDGGPVRIGRQAAKTGRWTRRNQRLEAAIRSLR
jgi:hypothetical protein